MHGLVLSVIAEPPSFTTVTETIGSGRMDGLLATTGDYQFNSVVTSNLCKPNRSLSSTALVSVTDPVQRVDDPQNMALDAAHSVFPSQFKQANFFEPYSPKRETVTLVRLGGEHLVLRELKTGE